MKKEIFISLDIEADGSNIYQHNCIQIGMVACYFAENVFANQLDKWVIDDFSVCIKEEPGHLPEPRTMSEFWSKNMDTYNKIQTEAIPAKDAIQQISDWLHKLSKTFNIKKFVARPASYDWLWFSSLYQKYDVPDKFVLPFSIICVSSLGFALEQIGISYQRKVRSRNLPHTHDAKDDALSQAYMFLRMIDLLKGCSKSNEVNL